MKSQGQRSHSIDTLPTIVDRAGKDILRCDDRCAGIWLDREAGILPRGLYLERREARGRGCFAVGINPGASKPKERDFYLNSGITLKSLNEYRESISDNPYFARSRSVIDRISLGGPILWTNLAKCQNEKGRKGFPPLQTLRHCVHRFLRRELDAIPAGWAVLGIGSEAYRALAYLVPDRVVIGIPHPTGAFQAFRRMFQGGDIHNGMRKEIMHRACRALTAKEPTAIWFGVQGPGM